MSLSRSLHLSCAFVVVAGLVTAPGASRAADDDPFAACQPSLADCDLAPLVSDDAFASDAPLPLPGDLLTLRRNIAEVVARTGAPGAAVALIGPGGVMLTEGFGRAGAEIAMDERSLFRVGSITKSFISLAVMRLVEQGKLRLEDRVAALAPELAVFNRWERTHPLQIAHLLEHTSGFDEMRFNEIFDRPATRGKVRSLAAVLAVNPRSRRARWPPGTRFSYSQPGYTTAAYLIEKASGQPYAQFLANEVFRPLGIEASVTFDEETRRKLAVGHYGGHRQPYVHLLHRPSMNLMISAHGLSRLLRLMLGRGTIDGVSFLSPASIERIERSGTLPYGPPTVRYGLGNWGDVSAPVLLRGHGGFMPGYASYYRYSVAHGFGFAVLVNDASRWNTLGGINKLLLRYLLAGQPLPRPPTVSVPPSELVRWTGRYQMRAPEIEFLRFHSDVYEALSLAEHEGRLWLKDLRRGRTVALVPSGPGQFRHPRESGGSVQLIDTAGGGRAVIVGQTYFEAESPFWARARQGLLELALLLLMSTAWIPFFLLLRRRGPEAGLLGRPFFAAACLAGMALAFDRARDDGTLGLCTPVTLAVWLCSGGFALGAYWSFSRALAGDKQDADLPRGLRAYALAVTLAAVWIALHLSRYGLIGLRTWRW